MAHQSKTAPKTKRSVSGDYYGSGVKAKVGRMRGYSIGINPVPKKKLKTPPKAVG